MRSTGQELNHPIGLPHDLSSIDPGRRQGQRVPRWQLSRQGQRRGSLLSILISHAYPHWPLADASLSECGLKDSPYYHENGVHPALWAYHDLTKQTLYHTTAEECTGVHTTNLNISKSKHLNPFPRYTCHQGRERTRLHLKGRQRTRKGMADPLSYTSKELSSRRHEGVIGTWL